MVNNQSPIVKLLMLAISATSMAIGLAAIFTEYAPASWTRYGLVGPLFGKDAKMFGAILIFVSLIPLLVFCKTAKQATIIGSLLFLLLIATIFGGIYLIN
jgi:accessory gene regulator protein AgrB